MSKKPIHGLCNLCGVMTDRWDGDLLEIEFPGYVFMVVACCHCAEYIAEIEALKPGGMLQVQDLLGLRDELNVDYGDEPTPGGGSVRDVALRVVNATRSIENEIAGHKRRGHLKLVATDEEQS